MAGVVEEKGEVRKGDAMRCPNCGFDITWTSANATNFYPSLMANYQPMFDASGLPICSPRPGKNQAGVVDSEAEYKRITGEIKKRIEEKLR